jgi:predicted RNase H-related nuclease YkuK (DUF458 family)
MWNKRWLGSGSAEINLEKQIRLFTKKGYKIFIGTDSKVYTDNTKFVTVVGLRNPEAKNGVIVYRLIEKGHHFYSLHDRLLAEVSKSLSVAEEIRKKLDTNCSIHIDINPDEKYKSNKFYDELVGMVKGCDFPVEAKHKSWAADIADMYT